MEYRRIRQEGGTYFFTVNLADRSGSLLIDRIHDLRNAVRTVKQRHPFDIVAWVVLPDHLHAIWTLPEGDGDCATRWMLIKAGFSRAIPKNERVVPLEAARESVASGSGASGNTSSPMMTTCAATWITCTSTR